MKRTCWSFYRLDTGEFTGRRFHARDDRALDLNTPGGCGALAGVFDRLSQRVDPETGHVVQWVNTPALQELERRQRRSRALARVRDLELRTLRPRRELDQDPSNEKARQVLDAIYAEIDSLTPLIRDGTDTSARPG